MADEFDTDKGLKDDYDGVITEAWFGVPEGSTASDLHLFLKKIADDGEEVEDRYRVGTDWASFDGGVTAEHATKTKMRADAQVSILVEHAFQSGAEEVIRERSAANGSKGAKTAAIWPGLKFHWTVVSKEYDFKDKQTGEKIEGVTNRSYPDKFLGVQEAGIASPTTGGGGVGASSTESTGSSTGSPFDGVPDEVRQKVVVLAQSMDHSKWVDACLQLTEVRDSGTLLSALGDESFYNSLKGT